MPARSSGFRQEGVAHRPLVPLAAGRTMGADFLLADAQERADLALDTAVNLASRRRADEYEMFHDGLHWRTALELFWRPRDPDAITSYTCADISVHEIVNQSPRTVHVAGSPS